MMLLQEIFEITFFYFPFHFQLLSTQNMEPADVVTKETFRRTRFNFVRLGQVTVLVGNIRDCDLQKEGHCGPCEGSIRNDMISHPENVSCIPKSSPVGKKLRKCG